MTTYPRPCYLFHDTDREPKNAAEKVVADTEKLMAELLNDTELKSRFFRDVIKDTESDRTVQLAFARSVEQLRALHGWFFSQQENGQVDSPDMRAYDAAMAEGRGEFLAEFTAEYLRLNAAAIRWQTNIYKTYGLNVFPRPESAKECESLT